MHILSFCLVKFPLKVKRNQSRSEQIETGGLGQHLSGRPWDSRSGEQSGMVVRSMNSGVSLPVFKPHTDLWHGTSLLSASISIFVK